MVVNSIIKKKGNHLRNLIDEWWKIKNNTLIRREEEKKIKKELADKNEGEDEGNLEKVGEMMDGKSQKKIVREKNEDVTNSS